MGGLSRLSNDELEIIGLCPYSDSGEVCNDKCTRFDNCPNREDNEEK